MRTLAILGLALLALCGACQQPADTASEASDLTTLLASADGRDGTVDQVVSQCLTCHLAMPGSDEHKASHAEYEFLFCSERCVGHFEEDPEGALAAVDL